MRHALKELTTLEAYSLSNMEFDQRMLVYQTLVSLLIGIANYNVMYKEGVAYPL